MVKMPKTVLVPGEHLLNKLISQFLHCLVELIDLGQKWPMKNVWEMQLKI